MKQIFRKIKFPKAATLEEWDQWHKDTKSEQPFMYFWQITVPKFWRVNWLRVKLTNLYWAIRHRTIDRYHVISTGLKPGYYDKDTQLTYACFNLLKKYVEVELAHLDENKSGLAYLDWEISLGNPNLPESEQSPRQAASAREIKEIYLWWVEQLRNNEYWYEVDYEKETEMLIRLVKIRGSLWS